MKSAGKAICILLMFWLALVPAHAATPTKPATKSSVKAKSKAKSKTTKPGRAATPAISSRPDPVDEAGLDAEVVAARRIVTRKPADVEARLRLARAAIVLIDWLLRAEAVGDNEKVQRLTEKLVKDLHDTGWRVQKMAQKGDLMARQAAGFLLGSGVLLKKDFAKSCAEFLAAAEMLAPAGWHAAQCLMEASPDKAWAQMERAAKRGHAEAQEWMGRRCLGEFGAAQKDFVCARDYLVQSASLGRPHSQTLLAFMLINGQGGPVDAPRAVRLYTAAAEKGDVSAQNNLGEMNETGRGVPKNPDEAIRWYERAAEKGFGAAQFNAGRLWAIGVGDRKDPAKARALLVQAEANGVPQARQVLDWLDQQAAAKADETPAPKPATPPDGDTVRAIPSST